MSHYHLDIPVEKEDVQVIKRDMDNYLEKCGGLTICIIPDNPGEDEEFKEVELVFKKLLVRLIALIGIGNFKGLN